MRLIKDKPSPSGPFFIMFFKGCLSREKKYHYCSSIAFIKFSQAQQPLLIITRTLVYDHWDLGLEDSMASEAPSWADQWGAGGIGAMEDEDITAKKENGNKKSEGKGGFNKAKTAVLTGAKKLKLGASKSFTWVKNKSQKKGSSK
ncbi:hypothetical protein DITRI_Ditri02bG0012000 [Diplodiscus trichospermus]